jgi:type IV pilus assembly protein PilN
MRIAINLATRPYADLGPAVKRLRIAMAVLLAAAVGLAFGLRAFHQKAEEARAKEHALDSRIMQITQERQGFQELMRQPANVLLLTQTASLNRLFDEKSFSWTLAMEDLETVLPGGVQVVTLEPTRAKDGHITLHLRVIGPRDRALELVKNLEHSRHFLLPRISGESAEASGSPGEKMEPFTVSSRVNFDLLADYNPSGPLDRRILDRRTLDRRAERTLEPVKERTVTPPMQASPPFQAGVQPRLQPLARPSATHPPLLLGAPMQRPMQPVRQQFARPPGPTPNPNAGGPE